MPNSLLPDNSSVLEHSIDEVAKKSTALPVEIDTLFNPDTCPAHLLGHLAWSLSIDYWSPDLPELIKRQVCRDAIEVHRYKGTVYAVIKALQSTGVPVTVVEWFENGGAAYTFEVLHIENTLLSDKNQQIIIKQVERTKNVRSQFAFVLPMSAMAQLQLGAHARPLLFRRLESTVN